jgi:predicted transcriptional regulator
MLQTETRQRVYNFIEKTPGAHLREIGRRLGMSLGHLRYHLRILEKKNLIISIRNGFYRRYFVKKDFDVGLAGIFFALQQKNTRKIVLHLLNNPGSTHKDLLHVFDFPSSTLSLYLDNLVKKGVLQRVRNGRQNRYHVVDELNVVKVLKTYKESFIDKLIDRALEIYQESHF